MAFLGSIILFVVWFISTPWIDDSEYYGDVSWSQFYKALNKHIEQTSFKFVNYGTYEGSVFVKLQGPDKYYLDFGILGRSNFENGQDMQSLKFLGLKQIEDMKIICLDDDGHERIGIVNPVKLLKPSPKSISAVLNQYEDIRSVVSRFEFQNYIVEDGIVSGIPDWLNINTKSYPLENSHVMQSLSCKLKSGFEQT